MNKRDPAFSFAKRALFRMIPIGRRSVQLEGKSAYCEAFETLAIARIDSCLVSFSSVLVVWLSGCLVSCDYLLIVVEMF